MRSSGGMSSLNGVLPSDQPGLSAKERAVRMAASCYSFMTNPFEVLQKTSIPDTWEGVREVFLESNLSFGDPAIGSSDPEDRVPSRFEDFRDIILSSFFDGMEHHLTDLPSWEREEIKDTLLDEIPLNWDKFHTNLMRSFYCRNHCIDWVFSTIIDSPLGEAMGLVHREG